jgi:hypothetical protein
MMTIAISVLATVPATARRQPTAPPHDPLRDTLRRRAAQAIERAARAASPEALAEALSAPTDAGALARLLAGAAASGAIAELDPLADAIARGVEAREELIRRAGGLLSAAQAGAALGGISRQAVDKRRRAGQLLALSVGADWRYPAAQIGPDGTVPQGLAAVLRGMADAGVWAMLDFVLTPDDALGGLTPLDALRRGGAAAEAVRRLVAAREADAYA